MHEINRNSKDRRGSSPPFQEMEKWVDDGANGSHWVKMGVPPSRDEGHEVMGRLVQEKIVVAESEDESRWEDDGGQSVSRVFRWGANHF